MVSKPHFDKEVKSFSPSVKEMIRQSLLVALDSECRLIYAFEAAEEKSHASTLYENFLLFFVSSRTTLNTLLYNRSSLFKRVRHHRAGSSRRDTQLRDNIHRSPPQS